MITTEVINFVLNREPFSAEVQNVPLEALKEAIEESLKFLIE